jgi:hypothetical protein
MADITVDKEVGANWTTLINAASTQGVVSWKKPFELDIFVTGSDSDVPTGQGHRLDWTQQAGRSVFSSGCIKARNPFGNSVVIVAVTQS